MDYKACGDKSLEVLRSGRSDKHFKVNKIF